MKHKTYTHITKVERKEIAHFLKKEYSVREIARLLGRGCGTISEEISKNSVRGIYDPEKANHKAYARRKYSKYQGMKVAERSELKAYVEAGLREDWSPEEIAGRIKERDTHIPYVSRGAIYKFVRSPYGRVLENHLRYHRKRKRRGRPLSVTKLEGRKFIDERPKIIEKRRRFGDWEGDFIVSGKQGKGVLLVLHERKTRYVLMKKIVGMTIETLHRYIFELTGGVVMNTLTLDNDIIFRKHEELSRLLNIPVYFCHPYHSWEKGGVEYSNKLIRQYIPKGSDISQYSDESIQTMQDKLNNRPRKCLGYKTPLEAMEENHQLKNEINVMMSMPLMLQTGK
jgi:IS30 family transposase